MQPIRTRTGGKKSKARDLRPARKRYWMKRTLEVRKVKHIMRGLLNSSDKGAVAYARCKKAATKKWREDRKGRVPDEFLQKVYA